jgi:hypothetical protein
MQRIECDKIWEDQTLKTLASASDWKGIVDYCSGSNHCSYVSLWSLAMTAHFGPVGTHRSRVNERGTPDASKCVDCPRVFDTMHHAQREILRRMGLLTNRWPGT